VIWNLTTNGLPPKDGRVLVYGPCGIELVQYNSCQNCWDTDDGDDFYKVIPYFSHWASLPPNPNDPVPTEKELLWVLVDFVVAMRNSTWRGAKIDGDNSINAQAVHYDAVNILKRVSKEHPELQSLVNRSND
jgi:hypothetical protein